MCTPDFGIGEGLALASAAASAGGAIMNSNAQADNIANAINAKNQDAAALIAQENGLQKQSTGIFDQALQNYQGTQPTHNLNTAQAANTNTIAANAPTAAQLGSGATTGNAPKVVQDANNATIANRLSKIGQFGANLGTLSGYDTNNSNNARTLKDASNQIGTIGNFATEDQNVGAAKEQADVANSQQPMSPWGDLLSGAGQIGGLYAGKNGAFSNLFGGSVPAGTNGVTMNLGPYGSVTGATPAFSYGGFLG